MLFVGFTVVVGFVVLSFSDGIGVGAIVGILFGFFVGRIVGLIVGDSDGCKVLSFVTSMPRLANVCSVSLRN